MTNLFGSALPRISPESKVKVASVLLAAKALGVNVQNWATALLALISDNPSCEWVGPEHEANNVPGVVTFRFVRATGR